MVHELTEQADIIGINSASPLLFDDPDAAAETLAALRAESRIIAAGIYRADGSGSPSMTARRPQGPRYCRHSSARRQTGTVLSTNIWCSSGLLSVAGKRFGTVYILADLREIQQLTRYLGIAGLVGLASFALTLWLSLWLQRRISGPLVAACAHGAARLCGAKLYSPCVGQ